MDMHGYQYYREQAVNTMTPGELLLLLYDELVKRLTQAELSLSQEDYPTFEAAVDRSVAIIHYLDDTLDHQYPISAQLTRLYEYFCYELSRVKSGRNKTELERVKRMASELRESFRTAEKSSSAR
ncbi:flagellar export chaperone FliS [uncultured Pseudoflavonifractor sp.]|uniref:flagellar export chaperone FliS n=1 Tax=uncultured Pseudoflavonifractor sp. TaxID=1221379 RepID=UPI0025E842A3|nr:flagellar export chaperone FliS [uncultured Pseudoflavonifractor sp.]